MNAAGSEGAVLDDPLLVPVGAKALAALVLVHLKTALFA